MVMSNFTQHGEQNTRSAATRRQPLETGQPRVPENSANETEELLRTGMLLVNGGAREPVLC